MSVHSPVDTEHPTLTPRSSRGASTPWPIKQTQVTSIVPNPFQPRMRIEEDDDEFLALVQEMRTYGFHGSLEVRHDPIDPRDKLQLVWGERRWRAAKIANIITIPVRIIEADDEEMARRALVENLRRVDLTPYEEAIGFQHLQNFGYGYKRISQMVGKSKGYVASRLKLLKGTPEEIALAQMRDDSLSVLNALNGLEPEIRAELLARWQEGLITANDIWSLKRVERNYLAALESSVTDDGNEVRTILRPVPASTAHQVPSYPAAPIDAPPSDPRTDRQWEALRQAAIQASPAHSIQDQADLTAQRGINAQPQPVPVSSNGHAPIARAESVPEMTWEELGAELDAGEPPNPTAGLALAESIALTADGAIAPPNSTMKMVIDESTRFQSDHAKLLEAVRNAPPEERDAVLQSEQAKRQDAANAHFLNTLEGVLLHMRTNIERSFPHRMSVEQRARVRTIRAEISAALAIY